MTYLANGWSATWAVSWRCWCSPGWETQAVGGLYCSASEEWWSAAGSNQSESITSYHSTCKPTHASHDWQRSRFTCTVCWGARYVSWQMEIQVLSTRDDCHAINIHVFVLVQEWAVNRLTSNWIWQTNNTVDLYICNVFSPTSDANKFPIMTLKDEEKLWSAPAEDKRFGKWIRLNFVILRFSIIFIWITTNTNKVTGYQYRFWTQWMNYW